MPEVKQSYTIHCQNPVFNRSMKLSMKLFLLLRTAPRSKVSNEVSMCSFDTYCMQGRVIPEDVVPSLTTQLETNSGSENLPASTVDSEIQSK